MPRLADLADVLRSKNAGPLHLTFDLMFRDRAAYERVRRSGALTPERIGALYGVPAVQVAILPYDVVRAIKITLPRRHASGALEDDDIYGCQQHGPLAGLEIPDAPGPDPASPAAGAPAAPIPATLIEDVLYRTIRTASTRLPPDVRAFFEQAIARETAPAARASFQKTLESVTLAEQRGAPTCPDTGWPLFFVKVGNAARLAGGLLGLEAAARRMVARATREGLLRSTMKHPLTGADPGTNVGMNIPDFTYRVAPGADLEITFVAKGGGSECFGGTRHRVIAFADGLAGIQAFLLEAYAASARAGAICPPAILGVGLGGTANLAAALAKQAACLRPVGSRHPDPAIAALETNLTRALDRLGIGPMGMGGRVSVMAVHIEYAYTHIAGIAVATSSNCWIVRRCTHRIAADGRVTRLDDPRWFGERT